MENEVPAKIKEKLLSFLRDGKEYAHPGGEEAIDMLFSDLSKDEKREILDVGCGLGGTANYIKSSGYGKVTAIDISEGVIESAKVTYKDIAFYCCDVMDVDKIIKPKKFDLICMINSFFYFPNQLEALKKLRKLAHDQTQLLIFEYTDLSHNRNSTLKLNGDKGESIFNPIKKDDIKQLLSESGWAVGKYIDISPQYQNWYQNLVDNIKSKKHEIIDLFSEEAYSWAESIYNGILNSIKKREMGGCILKGISLSAKLKVSNHLDENSDNDLEGTGNFPPQLESKY